MQIGPYVRISSALSVVGKIQCPKRVAILIVMEH